MDSQVMPTVIPIWLSGGLNPDLLDMLSAHAYHPPTGFDDIMPDTRKYLRFFPRPGKSASITVGDPITQRLVPHVKRWRGIVAGQSHDRSLGIGGDWGAEGWTSHVLAEHRRERRPSPDPETVVRQARSQAERTRREKGDIAGGEEERIRIAMCDVMYDELSTLGRAVEAKEGKDRRPWRNAVARVKQ